MAGVFLFLGHKTQIQRECDVKMKIFSGRDQGDAPASQGMPKIASKWPEGRTEARSILPMALGRSQPS